MPSSEPSPVPSSRPSQCQTTYVDDILSNDFGNLVSCSIDDDCGGFEQSDGTVIGARCNLDLCACECDTKYCLANVAKKSTDDMMCQFQCDCKEGCISVNNANFVEGTDFTWSNTNANQQCDTSQCTDCSSDPTACGLDQDCIPDSNGNAICVESGICTADKNAICDDAYAAVTQNSNNRAKCCPSTSSCVKTIIGVIATSTCSNNCGNCLGSTSNPGSDQGYSPATFCLYGNRVDNMPECTVISNDSTGAFSCLSGNDNTGDESLCCTSASSPNVDAPGDFTCSDDGTFGTNVIQSWSPSAGPMCVKDQASRSSVAQVDVNGNTNGGSTVTPLC
mmetsp:Transcript_5781/g.8499  ORF Transcript_5781/g.8499 Transcript_5781/m.8499 type:complete len:335 (-) Transcript_5781:211-1215(-)